MIKETISGTIKSIERHRPSAYGNPNYSIKLETANGVEIKVSTLNDYGVNYEIHGGLVGMQVNLIVKVNKYSNKLLEVV
jgi:hypothetical protein